MSLLCWWLQTVSICQISLKHTFKVVHLILYKLQLNKDDLKIKTLTSGSAISGNYLEHCVYSGLLKKGTVAVAG